MGEEQPPKRRYRRRNVSSARKKDGDQPTSITEKQSDPSKRSDKQNNRRRGRSQTRKQPSSSTHDGKSSRSSTKEDTRLEEIANIEHRLPSIPEMKLINSTNKAKIFSATLPGPAIYKLTVPILKKLPVQLQSLPEKPSNAHVIKNFNNKVKPNDKPLLFYFNLLINDYEHLELRPEDFKLYNLTKMDLSQSRFNSAFTTRESSPRFDAPQASDSEAN